MAASIAAVLVAGMTASSGVVSNETVDPAPEPAVAASAPPAAAPASTATPAAPVPQPAKACSSKGKWGTKPHVTRIGHHIAARFDISNSKIGGYRAAAIDRQGHPAGLALDFTVGRAAGDRIATYLLANQDRLGVRYVIWRQRLNYGSGWEPMRDRGGVTANHYDHVHVSFKRTPSGIAITC